MNTLRFKAGATFSFGGTVLLPSGTWSAACQVRRKTGDTVAEITVDLEALEAPTEEASHTIVLETDADTSSWPVEELVCDVLFYDSSDPPKKVPTDTFLIAMERRGSHA